MNYYIQLKYSYLYSQSDAFEVTFFFVFSKFVITNGQKIPQNAKVVSLNLESRLQKEIHPDQQWRWWLTIVSDTYYLTRHGFHLFCRCLTLPEYITITRQGVTAVVQGALRQYPAHIYTVGRTLWNSNRNKNKRD